MNSDGARKIGYLQCIGGASGDMLLGAVIDAGVPVDDLNAAIALLGVSGVKVAAHPDQRRNVHGTRVRVEVDASSTQPSGLEEFVRIVDASQIPMRLKEQSIEVLRRIRKAESLAHRQPSQDLHLEELGDVDTLVDVVCTVVGLDALCIGRLYSSPLPSGSGLIETAHGILPVPTPATAALLGMANARVAPPPCSPSDAGEMVTPTGAAIVTTLADFLQPSLQIETIGYGLGTRNPISYPNALVLWVGTELDDSPAARVSLLETNIDDCTPEILGYTQEMLFAVGALDVWFTPIQMKKNRPAVMLSALVPARLEEQAIRLILRETSSLGVRMRPIARYEADRKSIEATTSLGTVSVKVKKIDGVPVAVSPEYEHCRKIAVDKGLPLQEVYRIVQREAADSILSSDYPDPHPASP